MSRRVTRSCLVFALTLTPLALITQAADAQRGRPQPSATPAIGLRTGWDFQRDAWGLGASVQIPVNQAVARPSGDYFFVEDGSSWQLNADFAARAGRRGAFYIGSGLAVWYRSITSLDVSDTELGLNFFGGFELRSPRSRVGLFVEPRITIKDGTDPFYLAFGLTFVLARPQRR